MKATTGKICVSYRPALVAAAMAAAAAALPAAAADEIAISTPSADVSFQEPVDDYYDDEIVVGGITDAKKAEVVEVKADADVPELPVIIEDKAPAKVSRPAAP